jgi:glycosyltransferase involved in cell wall biosynthesis
MRVAHFVQRYPPALGGSEAYFARLGRYLADAGDRVTVFTTNAVDLEAFWSTRGRCRRPGVAVEAGVEVRRYPLWRWTGQNRVLRGLHLLPHHTWQCLTISCNPLAFGMLRDAGRANVACDLVHATAFPYGWVIASGWRLARRLRVPFLVTPFLHLGDPDDPRDRTRQVYLQPALLAMLQAADCVFVQTQVEREALLERGYPDDKLVLQGMGVDPGECTGGDRGATRAAWGVAPEEVVVGHLANNSREKGSVDLLRAAERAWERGARFHLVLAGPEMPNFRAFWRHYRHADRVRRLGVLDDRQKRNFFAALDVFALPSRSDSFGLVLLEAWANGVPNVAYRAGGVAGVIRPEEDGLLARCGDVEDLSAALVRLVADGALRRRFAAAGRERVRCDFRWEDKLALVRQAYEEFGARKTAGTPARSASEGTSLPLASALGWCPGGVPVTSSRPPWA